MASGEVADVGWGAWWAWVIGGVVHVECVAGRIKCGGVRRGSGTKQELGGVNAC